MIKLEERKQHKSNQLQAYNKEQEKKKKKTNRLREKLLSSTKELYRPKYRRIHKDI